MNKKQQKISALVVIIVLLLVSMRANPLLANYPIIPDLTIESMQQEGTINEPFQLKIVDANSLDTKVWLPLPTNISFSASQNEHGSVTYDAVNHQLVIDWTNQEEENRFVTIELTASEAGNYEFQATVMREEETVASQSVAINVIEEAHEEEVEAPVENEQPEVAEEEQREESNAETQQKIENIEQPIIENEAAETRVGETDDPRIGLPIKDIFPDTEFAKAVAQLLNKNITDIFSKEDSTTQHTFLDFSNKNITDPTGMTIFKNWFMFNLSHNNIQEIPDELLNLKQQGSSSKKMLDFSYNQIEVFPSFVYDIDMTTLFLSHNRIKILPKIPSHNIYLMKAIDLSNNQLYFIEDSDSLAVEKQLAGLDLSNNYLTNLPESLIYMHDGWSVGLKHRFGVSNNLLPDDGTLLEEKINSVHGIKVDYGLQKQLQFQSETIITGLAKETDVEGEALMEKLKPYIYANDESLPNDFPITLLDFKNESGETVDIKSYFKDGKSIQNETIYIKAQSRTSGLFDSAQNTNTVTPNQAQLKLKIFGDLSFVQAPAQLSFGDDLKIKTTAQVLPLQSFDMPLSIQDDKAEKSTWRMTAKMTKELTSPSNKVLENSLHYRLNGEDTILNKTEINIYTQQNTSDEPFNISDTWLKDDQNGLFLEIKAGQALAEEYTGTIEWKLQDVPSNATE